MFTKTTIALAIIVSITSGAFAATKQAPQGPGFAPATTWQDPYLAGKNFDSYGMRWE